MKKQPTPTTLTKELGAFRVRLIIYPEEKKQESEKNRIKDFVVFESFTRSWSIRFDDRQDEYFHIINYINNEDWNYVEFFARTHYELSNAIVKNENFINLLNEILSLSYEKSMKEAVSAISNESEEEILTQEKLKNEYTENQRTGK